MYVNTSARQPQLREPPKANNYHPIFGNEMLETEYNDSGTVKTLFDMLRFHENQSAWSIRIVGLHGSRCSQRTKRTRMTSVQRLKGCRFLNTQLDKLDIQELKV